MQKRRSTQLELAWTAHMQWEDVPAALREQVQERSGRCCGRRPARCPATPRETAPMN